MRPVDPKMHWNNEPTIIAPCSSLIISLNFCTKHTQVLSQKFPKEKQIRLVLAKKKTCMLSEVPKLLRVDDNQSRG